MRTLLPSRPTAARARRVTHDVRAVEPAIHLRQILRWDGMLRVLVEPDRRRDPPPRPVPEQLDAVDPASHDGSLRRAPLLVGAERMHDVAVFSRDAVDLLLEEAVAHKPRVRVIDERLVVHDRRVRSALAHPGRHEPHARDVERAVPRPLAGLSRGSRNHLVEGLDDAVDGGDVLRPGRERRHGDVLPGGRLGGRRGRSGSAPPRVRRRAPPSSRGPKARGAVPPAARTARARWYRRCGLRRAPRRLPGRTRSTGRRRPSKRTRPRTRRPCPPLATRRPVPPRRPWRKTERPSGRTPSRSAVRRRLTRQTWRAPRRARRRDGPAAPPALLRLQRERGACGRRSASFPRPTLPARGTARPAGTTRPRAAGAGPAAARSRPERG